MVIVARNVALANTNEAKQSTINTNTQLVP